MNTTVEGLIAENKQLRAENIELKATVAQLSGIIVQLQARIEELERRLGLNSSNSSKPPSSDGLSRKQRIKSEREKSKKPSGGQTGHKGTTLAQVTNPDVVKEYSIENCPNCAYCLLDVPVIQINKRQVFDLPEIKPYVTEYQFEVKSCPGCKKQVEAVSLESVNAPVQYGPKVAAAAVYLQNSHFIPEERTQEILSDLFGVRISEATLMNINVTCVENLKETGDKISEEVDLAAVKHLDETGFRMKGKTGWLHVKSTKKFTHYRVSLKRGDIADIKKGVVVHDHFKSYYSRLPSEVSHGLCNAHHIRELNALIEEKEEWAKKLKRVLRFGIHYVNEKNAPMKPELFKRYEAIYDRVVNEGLRYHESLGVFKKPARGRVKKRIGHNLLIRLSVRKADVLRFAAAEGVPFTNNQAEQDIRMMKVKQKVSGGFRTVDGAERFALIRSYISTIRKHGGDVLDGLTKAMQGNTELLPI